MLRRIVIYGGSFNPITRAHEAVIDSIMANIRPDCLLVVPTRVHAYGNKVLAPIEQRVAICNAALAKYANDCVLAADRETEVAGHMNKNHPEGTTLRYLMAERALADIMFKGESHISFVVGQDQAEDIAQGKWYKGEQLVSAFHAIIVPRGQGGSISKENCPWAFTGRHMILPALPADVADISSTKAREAIVSGSNSVRTLLSPPVLDAIQQHSVAFN